MNKRKLASRIAKLLRTQTKGAADSDAILNEAMDGAMKAIERAFKKHKYDPKKAKRLWYSLDESMSNAISEIIDELGK